MYMHYYVHALLCTCTYVYAYIVGSLPRWKVNSDLGSQKVQKEHITISQHTQHTQIQSSSYTASWQWGQEEHWWALEGDSTSTDYNNSNWSYDCQNHSIQKRSQSRAYNIQTTTCIIVWETALVRGGGGGHKLYGQLRISGMCLPPLIPMLYVMIYTLQMLF